MLRRAWLASVAVALSGCMNRGDQAGVAQTNLIFSLSMEQVTDREIARHSVPPLADVVPEADRPQLREAMMDGSVEKKSISPALRTDTVLQTRYEGSVYKIQSGIVDTHSVVRYEYMIAIDPVSGDVSDSEIVSFESLPKVDQTRLAEQGFDQVTDDSDLGYAFQLNYGPADQDESKIVPHPASLVVEYESGIRGQTRVVDTETQYLKTYRYTADKQGSLHQFGRTLRKEYAFSLPGLSEEQHEIISEAINTEEGYRVTGGSDTSVSETVRNLFEKFSERSGRALNHSKDSNELRSRAYFLLNYDGNTYWTELRFRPDVFQTDSG